MQTIVAVVSIVVEKEESVESLNALLHDFGEHIRQDGNTLPRKGREYSFRRPRCAA